MNLTRYYKSYFLCILTLDVVYYAISYFTTLPATDLLLLIMSLMVSRIVIQQFLAEQRRVPDTQEKYKLAKVFSLILFGFSLVGVVIGLGSLAEMEITDLLQGKVFILILIVSLLIVTALAYGITLLACGKHAEKKLKKILAAS